MNCLTHSETPATAYCRTCGRPLCAACQRAVEGVIYCEEHAPAAARPAVPPAAQAPPPVSGASAPSDGSPGLALLLGFIPGVGAIYNAQYAKGLVHAVIFGLLISIVNSGAAGAGLEPLFAILITVWVFYMALEAYHTARRRRAGETVDEFSSLVNLRGRSGSFPAGAVVLIVMGILLLLNTLEILQFRYFRRYWPVALILAGVYMLYVRLAPPGGSSPERR
jgi:hypothetical protein